MDERARRWWTGTCDTEVTKLGPMRADRKHWRAAEKFLAASIVNRSRQSALQGKGVDGVRREEKRKRERIEFLGARYPTVSVTALV